MRRIRLAVALGALVAAPLTVTPALAEDVTIVTPGGTFKCVSFSQGGASVGTSGASVSPTQVSFSSVGDCIK